MITVCSTHGRGVERCSRVSRSEGEQSRANVDTALERAHPSSALSLPLERQARQRKVHLKGGRKGANGVGPHVGFGGLRGAKAGWHGGVPRQWRPVGQPPVKSSMGYTRGEYARCRAPRHFRESCWLPKWKRIGARCEKSSRQNNGGGGATAERVLGAGFSHLRPFPRNWVVELPNREHLTRQKLGLALTLVALGRA